MQFYYILPFCGLNQFPNNAICVFLLETKFRESLHSFHDIFPNTFFTIEITSCTFIISAKFLRENSVWDVMFVFFSQTAEKGKILN